MQTPLAVIESLQYKSNSFYVVRDDLLPGGSKQRASVPLLQKLHQQGFKHFIYASPFAGFAQVALAFAAQQLNLTCHIFCEEDKTNSTSFQKHRFTKLAEKFGAQITIVKTLKEAELQAEFETEKATNHFKIPLGFNCIEFRDEFEIQLKKQWAHIIKKIGMTPKRVWLPLGSGTLLSVIRRVLPEKTLINCVNVNVLADEDPRIQAVKNDPRVTYYKTPEFFYEVAEQPPNIPSNIHYDAKLWRHLMAHGQTNDLWWNVAR
jgi:hypothetical protein